MARRKITDGIAIAAAAKDLPELTAQQQKFVEGVLAGKTASDAYRAAYDCSNMLASSIWCNASKLRSDEKVAQWIAQARIAGLGSATVTYEGHLRELERLKELALNAGNLGAAVQAEQLRGKVAGHHVDQVRDVTSQHDPIQTVRDLAALTGIDPHVIAAKHGVTLPDEGATKH